MLDWKRFTRTALSCCLVVAVVVVVAGGPASSQEEPKAGKPAAPAKPAAKAAAKPAAKPDAKAAPQGAPAVEAPINDSGEAGGYWIIEFEEKALRMIAPTDGLGGGQVYWYMLYTLTNKTKEDHDIYVKITATSDHDKQYADLFLPSVEKAIERRENTPLWGKADEFAALAKRKPSDPKYQYITIKTGEKRNCVAVFNRLDPNANKITIRVEGLSNEIKEVVKEDGARFLESRVRELTFDRPGDENAITLDSFTLIGQDWVKKQIAGGGSKGTAKADVPAAEPAPEGDAKVGADAGGSDGK
jgi:hypothetical protein